MNLCGKNELAAFWAGQSPRVCAGILCCVGESQRADVLIGGTTTCPLSERARENMVTDGSSSSNYSESAIPWLTFPKELHGE